jgi:hypothetical protein
MSNWQTEYDAVLNTPPKAGDILRALEGNVVLTVICDDGKPPFIFGTVNVPEIVGAEVGWFLQGEDDAETFHGWKCIIMPKARTELVKMFGVSSEKIMVQSLRVIRPSRSEKSLLCEVHKHVETP